MSMFWQILTFRRMIAPTVLQILFWAGIGGTLYGTHLLIHLGHWAWWMALVFGTLTTRVIFEGAILTFRTYNRLGEIRDALQSATSRADS